MKQDRWEKAEITDLRQLCRAASSLSDLRSRKDNYASLRRRSDAAIRRKAQKLGLLKGPEFQRAGKFGGKPVEEKTQELELAPKGPSSESFFGLFGGGKSLAELVAKSKLSEEAVRQLLANPPSGKKIFKDVTLGGEPRFFCIPDLADADKKPRSWKYVLAEDGGSAVDILMPENVGQETGESKSGDGHRRDERIRLVPLADVWFGHRLCDLRSLRERIAWIAREDHVFCFFNGDIIYPMSVRQKGQMELWDARCQAFYALCAPVARKILWAQGGCFELKMAAAGYDPMKMFCAQHEIPYFIDAPVSVGVHWAGNLFEFLCLHGRSQAQKKGSKMNAALRLLEQVEFRHFFVMSHVKDAITSVRVRVNEDVRTHDLRSDKQYVCITSSFVQYDGSREATWGYPLPSRGGLDCALFKDGRYFLYKSLTTNLVPVQV